MLRYRLHVLNLSTSQIAVWRASGLFGRQTLAEAVWIPADRMALEIHTTFIQPPIFRSSSLSLFPFLFTARDLSRSHVCTALTL